jgi:hypothetical protein
VRKTEPKAFLGSYPNVLRIRKLSIFHIDAPMSNYISSSVDLYSSGIPWINTWPQSTVIVLGSVSPCSRIPQLSSTKHEEIDREELDVVHDLFKHFEHTEIFIFYKA